MEHSLSKARRKKLKFEELGDLLSVDEVAEYLQVNRKWLLKQIRTDKLHGFKLDKSYRVKKEHLKDYIDSLAGTSNT